MIRSSDKKLLVVMAKEPVAGKVKTRLSPALAPEEAAALYQCMLSDRLREMGGLEGIDLALAFTPSSARDAFIPLARPCLTLFAQRGGDLGERLHNIFVDAFAEGYAAVSIIDSDSPDLPGSTVRGSFSLLLAHGAEVVFGPCSDGGYYLVGMRQPHPELFDDIPWSTPKVLEASLEKAREMGLKTELLCRWNDLDTFEDLLAFYAKYSGEERVNNRSRGETFAFLSRLEIIKRFNSI
jgi:rSAM/selenodomain-associated transferase 1